MVYTASLVKRQIDKSVSDWLYGEWDEGKYRVFTTLYSIHGFREYFDYLLDQRKDAEYMAANQLDWSDIHDPRKLSQTSSSSALSNATINFVSRNVTRLYRK